MPTRNHRSTFILKLVISLFCFTLLLGAQAADPITKNGLLRALQLKPSPKELISYITARGVDFVLTPEVEAELKAAGATPAVIEAVRTHSKAAPITTETVPVIPLPKKTVPVVAQPVAFAPGVYRKDGTQWIKILDEGVRWKKPSSTKKLTFGLVKGDMVGVVPGSSSPNLLKNPITFVIAVPDGAEINQYLLVQLKPKKGGREIDVSSSGSDSKSLVPFTSKKIAKGTYQIDFSQGAGDYGFLPPSHEADGEVQFAPRMFTFRVLE